MKTLNVALPGRHYEIRIQSGLLDQAGAHCRQVLPQAAHLYVVTDDTVAPRYLSRLTDSLAATGFQTTCHIIPAGEQSKQVRPLSQLWEGMMAAGITRSDAVVALGGGVVGDLAGFAAATILRGVDFIQIPTTLLAQVDSSVGGKVAIDLNHGKNLAGAFWQPKLVLMDPDTLNTLPDSVFADGMAEVIKYGFIADEPFLRFLEQHPSRPQIMEHIESVLYTCCNIKRLVVEEDERDTGGRMVLNFGHTLGHAYELAGHYQVWTHGQAVAAGMTREAELGVGLGLTPPSLAVRVGDLVHAFGLPKAISCTQEEYARAIGLDKKGSGDRITLILLDRPGHAIRYPMKKQALLDLL